MISNKDRKLLANQISKLTTTEHEEIFKVLQRHNLHYSQNKNGIFFNISSLDDDIVDEISGIVSYCMSQQDQLDQYDILMSECKMNTNVQKMDIKKHFETSANKQREEIKSLHEKLSETSHEKLKVFVEKIKQDREKIGKKKTITTFMNAKKRFIKKSSDRKQETDELFKDTYLVII